MKFNEDSLKTLTRILGRCTIIGLALVTVWFIAYLSGAICNVHGSIFGMEVHECSLLNYGGMGFLKILVLVGFFIPWIVVRLELQKHRKG